MTTDDDDEVGLLTVGKIKRTIIAPYSRLASASASDRASAAPLCELGGCNGGGSVAIFCKAGQC